MQDPAPSETRQPWDRQTPIEAFAIVPGAFIVFLASSTLNLFDRFADWVERNGRLDMGEFVAVRAFLVVAFVVMVTRKVEQARHESDLRHAAMKDWKPREAAIEPSMSRSPT